MPASGGLNLEAEPWEIGGMSNDGEWFWISLRNAFTSVDTPN
jgi:hypothetical protein